MHIVQRGNNRARCFTSPRDMQLYLGLVAEYGRRCEVHVHSYVLMPNHVHMLVTPAGSASSSDFMKQVGQRYAQYFNRTYSRSGAFWEGRFHSSIVGSDDYLFACHRYIELNPVRAGLCGNPSEYEWSSFRSNGLGEPSVVLSPHAQYLALGPDDVSRRKAYVDLFQAALKAEELSAIRTAISSGFAFGPPAFVEQLECELGTRAQIGKPGKPKANRGQTTFSR